VKFKRIKLENWRNFKEADIPLQDRAFVVGPNASGKSNFLDAFRFLRDIVTDGLEKAVQGEKRGGISKIRALSARKYSDIAIECELANSDGSLWIYRIEINQDNLRRPKIKKEIVKKDGIEILLRPNGEDQKDLELLRQTHLEQVSMNNKFRDIVDEFKAVRYLHLVPQLIREQDRVLRKQFDPYGSDFLEHIWRTGEKTRKNWLAAIESVIKIAVPGFQQLNSSKDEMGAPHLYFKHNHWRAYGAWQDEKDLSDGTIRLIGLLWAFLEGKGLLLLEEPELSLHSSVVSHLPEMMYRLQKKANRQAIVSTHSSDILQDKGIAADEIILLTPSREGTKVEVGASVADIKTLMDAGFSAAEATIPQTKPKDIDKLPSTVS
jgi:predicted ATPase